MLFWQGLIIDANTYDIVYKFKITDEKIGHMKKSILKKMLITILIPLLLVFVITGGL